MVNTQPAVLVLEDGKVFHGQSFGAVGQTLGEVVFCTAMTGYQETLTDPSYCGQILVSTAPHIGNTGWNNEDSENPTGKIWVQGYAVRNPSPIRSNWRSQSSLTDELIGHNIVGISGIDTRAVVLHLRKAGSMRGGIFSGAAAAKNTDELLTEIRAVDSMQGADFISEVSTKTPYTVEPVGGYRYTVAAVDLGIKSSTPAQFAARGIRTIVVPGTYSFEQIKELHVDGLFISNGPGDPQTATAPEQLVTQALEADLPLFGICFGNQIFGRALGRDTYKMHFGHRGINIPVIDLTGKVSITAQNHGFALAGEPGEEFATPYGKAVLSHYCPNDNTIEGVKLLSGRAFAVQFHPEAAAGPHDGRILFDEFTEVLAAAKKPVH